MPGSQTTPVPGLGVPLSPAQGRGLERHHGKNRQVASCRSPLAGAAQDRSMLMGYFSSDELAFSFPACPHRKSPALRASPAPSPPRPRAPQPPQHADPGQGQECVANRFHTVPESSF